MVPLSQISDGQVQASTATQVDPITTTMDPVTTISDGQIQAATASANAKLPRDISSTSETLFLNFDGAEIPMAVDRHTKPVGCSKNGTLEIALQNGVLTDALGRTGYIASNYQFQFDKPAQHGALYTAGFSACEGNLLALGNSTIFYQCRSGNFYNLYDRYWAAQCEPIELVLLDLQKC